MGRRDTSRNDTIEFARRTCKNLLYIEEARARGADVHAVTQLAVSLLGLVVFPQQRLLLDATKRADLAELAGQGWPSWTITRDEGKTPTRDLSDLLAHLRNAVAHGRLSFTSDSPALGDVKVLVEDKWARDDPAPYWCAEIDGPGLREFCLRFADYIDQVVG